MNAVAADIFARGFLTGFMDVVSALCGGSVPFEIKSLQSASTDILSRAFRKQALVVHAVAKDGGAFVILLSPQGANSVLAAATGQPPTADFDLATADLLGLKEIFDPCMGGGVSHFKEKYGKVIGLEKVEVAVSPAADNALFTAILEPSPVLVDFSFSIPPGAGGDGTLVFSGRFEAVIPERDVAAATSKAGGKGVGNPLSQDEISDILKESEPGAEMEPARAAKKKSETHTNDAYSRNLDMVLDIRLVATARLGRIEMPISEILSLGPGSIIEVGHLVDEPVELLVNDKLIARGDVVVVDEKFGLRITEIVSPRERIESLR